MQKNHIDSIKKIGVIGAGQMGSGIAQVAAFNGFDVIVRDIRESFLEKGQNTIEKNLSKLVKKGKISPEDHREVSARLSFSTDLSALEKADFIIEAATEREDLKRKIFEEIDELAQPEVVLGTNTSSISITKIASATQRPEKVIGIHFMNPVPMMKLVEVIRGLQTSVQTSSLTVALSEAMQNSVVTSLRDTPGFIVKRILMTMNNEAITSLYEGVGTPEDIDQAMKLGTNHPMGPLELADLIGLDTCLAIMDVLYTGFGDSKYRPCPLLRNYVDANLLGRKTGRGFYCY